MVRYERFAENAIGMVQLADIVVLLSPGVALVPGDAVDRHEALALADLWMYEAKEAGRGGWRAFERSSLKRISEQLSWMCSCAERWPKRSSGCTTSHS